ncbi:phosphate-starvation-inducible PsiE family protein [Suipraeoptans intestinalis]|uniref:Transporter n=1 Tax=Suipraeoptans intestinalis TaxID=2606628 RepID=A0A6N7V1W4_9FIRM|nr:phosphate-starvation-inducible PsiE family protein [Suipraeoptans intestinalis]MDD7769331.1 transporter [Suipraeoptans intestinalis]MDY3121673.1 transporter [Suipraeoptans intestinalis]MSR93272.1 transporter [Suipraeoptans intestinalis]
MRHYVSNLLRHLAVILEFFIAAMLSVGIILLCFRMATSLGHIPDLNVWPNYDDLLETCFNLIIGVELIRMMYYHTPNTVFEVLLFAIARQIIIEHSSPWSSLIGVTAIAVLFATRKFLFCEFDISDQVIFRATSKVKTINKLMGLQIPFEPGDTLGKVLLAQLEKEDIEIGTGACVYFQDCGLRVAKMHDGKISRIEVIRAIH